jgi:hypothetical protein
MSEKITLNIMAEKPKTTRVFCNVGKGITALLFPFTSCMVCTYLSITNATKQRLQIKIILEKKRMV